jgi:CelD/BcsL family acetyltransferase involved in cellulose biosynthesis
MVIGDVPAAVQIWLVREGRATIFKLAHRPEFDGHSPGTLLTHWMMSELCSRGEITEVDLGRGDDAYKRQWLHESSFRVGLIACNPASVRGLYRIASDVLPTRIARFVRRKEHA